VCVSCWSSRAPLSQLLLALSVHRPFVPRPHALPPARPRPTTRRATRGSARRSSSAPHPPPRWRRRWRCWRAAGCTGCT
jgi:hypothetical protein